jgi:hypothetical protein
MGAWQERMGEVTKMINEINWAGLIILLGVDATQATISGFVFGTYGVPLAIALSIIICGMGFRGSI